MKIVQFHYILQDKKNGIIFEDIFLVTLYFKVQFSLLFTINNNFCFNKLVITAYKVDVKFSYWVGLGM